jgi:AMMECR1 domain-containing protein
MFKYVKFFMIKKNTVLILPIFILFFLLSFAGSGCEKDKTAAEETADASVSDEKEVEEAEVVDQIKLIDDRFSEYVDSIEVNIDGFIDLSYEDKEYLMDVAYKAVDDYFTGSGGEEESLFLEKYDGIDRKVFIGFGVAGSKKGSYSARKSNLAESVYVATQRTIEDTRYGGGITEDDLSDLKIEIIILGDEKLLDGGYEKGIHGLRVEKGGKEATYYNTVAIEGNHDLNTLLAKLCEKAGLDGDCYEDNSVSIYYFPTIHFATTRFSNEITTFYRCNVIDFKPDINSEKVKNSLDMAEGWMLLNLDEEGNFNYEYSPSEGKYSTSNNMIRQLMSSRWLAEKSSENDVLLQMHKVNLEFVLRNWYKENGDLGYIYFDNKSKIGANGMALRVLVFSPYFEQYRNEAEKLANTLQYLQDEDGSLSAWYIEPDYSYDEEDLLTYYSGEAILSLVEMYEKTGDNKYLDSAVKSQDYYIGEYVDLIDENYFPAYVPWHTISLYKLYRITGSDRYRDAVFTLNDRLIQMQNQDGKPYIDFLGRFYDPDHPEYGVPFSGSTAVYVEGLTYAYELAEMAGDAERMYEYKKSILLGVHDLINLQFDGADMYYLSHPERVEGAIRYRVDDNRIRIDTTQHTIDAFIRVMDVFYK